MLRQVRSVFRVLRSRQDFEQRMSEELRFHIEQYSADLIRSGVSAEEAARRAWIEFGSLNSVEEECREARGLYLFDELFRQFRHACRSLRKTPTFTLTALATLTVCLGANLTIFSALDAILLRPLPFPAPQQLVTVFNTYPKAGVDRDGSSITNYYERRGQIPAFSALAIYRYGSAIVGNASATSRVPIARVSPEFFATLGTGPVIGRGFTEEETTLQTDKVVILTDAYWRQHFNSDPNVTGRTIRMDGMAMRVIGVLPPEFRFLSSEARLYLPFSSRAEQRIPAERHSGGNSRHLIARLKAGATLAQAQAQIDTQNSALELGDPRAKMMADAGFRSMVLPLHADHVASVRPVLLWIQAGAVLLLLIGLVNLTNLLFVRANGRLKELAVRQALGASQWHVISEILVETTLLTLSGTVLGLAVGAVGIRLLSAFGANHLPLGSRIALDGRIAWAALLGAVALGVILAIPIAWFHLRGRGTNAIQTDPRGGTSNRAAQGLRHVFIAGQIALAVILLAGAGLLGLSLERAMATSPGFRPDHVFAAQVSVPWTKYGNWRARRAFNERLLEEMQRQPGVLAAGVTNNIPLSGNSGKSAATVKGHVLRPAEGPRGHYSYGVDGNYFGAMGFELKEGRFLGSEDSRRMERVCVVDDDFAHYYWPHSRALGQRLFAGATAGTEAEAFTVVGVVGAVKQAGLTDPSSPGAVYYPYALRSDDSLFVVVRSSIAAESIGPVLQRVVQQIDPELPVNDLRTMQTRIVDSLATYRAPALLAAVFAGIALLLTAVGTYGVLSYAVVQRRREIGVRMALGARPGQIQAQFVGLALRLLGVGTALGILGAWLTGHAMRTLLFQVPPLHPATLAMAAGVIGAVSLLACLVPSHRASRISPSEALAEE